MDIAFVERCGARSPTSGCGVPSGLRSTPSLPASTLNPHDTTRQTKRNAVRLAAASKMANLQRDGGGLGGETNGSVWGTSMTWRHQIDAHWPRVAKSAPMRSGREVANWRERAKVAKEAVQKPHPLEVGSDGPKFQHHTFTRKIQTFLGGTIQPTIYPMLRHPSLAEWSPSDRC